MWGGTDVKIPAGILFMAVKGVHASLPPCPFCGPAKAHPIPNCRRTTFELYVDPDRHPGGYSYLRLEIFRLNPCVCDGMRVEMRAGDQRAIGAVAKRGAGRVTRAYKSHVVSHTCMSAAV